MPGKTSEKGGKVEALVLDIRKRKGLKPDIPTLDQFYDKVSSPSVLLQWFAPLHSTTLLSSSLIFRSLSFLLPSSALLLSSALSALPTLSRLSFFLASLFGWNLKVVSLNFP